MKRISDYHPLVQALIDILLRYSIPAIFSAFYADYCKEYWMSQEPLPRKYTMLKRELSSDALSSRPAYNADLMDRLCDLREEWGSRVYETNLRLALEVFHELHTEPLQGRQCAQGCA